MIFLFDIVPSPSYFISFFSLYLFLSNFSVAEHGKNTQPAFRVYLCGSFYVPSPDSIVVPPDTDSKKKPQPVRAEALV